MIIGLGHQSRVGKDTVGNYLVKEHGFNRYAFADVLKQAAYNLFRIYGLRDAAYYEQNPVARNEKLDSINLTPVELWIAYGTKMREIYEYLWVDLVIESLILPAVITDVRYPNEARAIKDAGGVLVKVTRKGNPVHGSDKHMPPDYPWDHVIANDGSLRDLYFKVASLLEHLHRPS